jgi:hypothetical protein
MIFRSPVSSSSVRISHSSFWPFSILQEKRSGTLSLIAFSSPPDGTRAGELHLWAVFDLD